MGIQDAQHGLQHYNNVRAYKDAVKEEITSKERQSKLRNMRYITLQHVLHLGDNDECGLVGLHGKTHSEVVEHQRRMAPFQAELRRRKKAALSTARATSDRAQ